MDKFSVIEMQNGIIGSNAWTYDTQADAEVKYYQVLTEVVKSPVAVHTVLLVDGEGRTIDRRCYYHETNQNE